MGFADAGLLKLALPALPVHTPPGYAILAEMVAVRAGMAAGCCLRGTQRGSIRSRR